MYIEFLLSSLQLAYTTGDRRRGGDYCTEHFSSFSPPPPPPPELEALVWLPPCLLSGFLPVCFAAGAGAAFAVTDFCLANTAFTASSKTTGRFFWVSAEHSMYLNALISFASLSPYRNEDQSCATKHRELTSSCVTGFRPCSLRLAKVSACSRVSNLVPTNKMGVSGL